jgi:hypothetical protein
VDSYRTSGPQWQGNEGNEGSEGSEIPLFVYRFFSLSMMPLPPPPYPLYSILYYLHDGRWNLTHLTEQKRIFTAFSAITAGGGSGGITTSPAAAKVMFY